MTGHRARIGLGVGWATIPLRYLPAALADAVEIHDHAYRDNDWTHEGLLDADAQFWAGLFRGSRILFVVAGGAVVPLLLMRLFAGYTVRYRTKPPIRS